MNDGDYAYLEEINQGIIKFTGENQRILDVGCGFGALGEALKKKGNYIVGLDVSQYAINIAKKRIDEAYLADATKTETLPLSLDEQFDLIIASTAKGMHYKNIRRLAIFPKDLQLPISQNPLSIALVFGKESRGLTNEEIEVADILVRIPSDDAYPTLNLSHACGIILYEIYNKIHDITIGRGLKPVLLANKKDKQILYNLIKSMTKSLKVRTYTAENIILAFRNVFERAMVSKKELNLILGVLSKLNSLLKKRKIYDE